MSDPKQGTILSFSTYQARVNFLATLPSFPPLPLTSGPGNDDGDPVVPVEVDDEGEAAETAGLEAAEVVVQGGLEVAHRADNLEEDLWMSAQPSLLGGGHLW